MRMSREAFCYKGDRGIPSKSQTKAQKLVRLGDLRRIKLAATVLLALSITIAVVARLFKHNHRSLGYIAAWAEAATIGGLADWYAVVALFSLTAS